MIKEEDITFVIQGSIDKKNNIVDVIKSIRRFYFKSTIILSTWDCCIIDEQLFDVCDEIVKSKDPGDGTIGSTPNLNINRQIVSSLAGINRSKTKITVKTRTDIIFKNNNLLKLINKKYHTESDYMVGKGRLLCTDYSTRHNRKGYKVSFWVCDFIYVGYTDDIKKMFSVNQYSKENFEYFKDKDRPEYFLDNSHCFRYTPETYLTLSYVKCKFPNFSLNDTFHNDEKINSLFEKIILNSFVIYTPIQLGIESLKYRYPMLSRGIVFTNNDWVDLYNNKRLGFSFDNILSEVLYRVKFKINSILGRRK